VRQETYDFRDNGQHVANLVTHYCFRKFCKLILDKAQFIFINHKYCKLTRVVDCRRWSHRKF